MKRLLIIATVLLLVSGCAKAPTPDHDVEMKLADAIGSCYEAEGAAERAAINKLTDPKDILLFQTVSALKSVATKGEDRCSKIVTNNVLQKVAMEENTKQIGHASDFGKSAIGNLAVLGLGWKLIDGLPDWLGAAGSGTTINANRDLAITDSFKSPVVQNISGNPNIGGILNPATAEPFMPETIPVE